MSDITIVVDCNDADFARDICAALQQFPDVTALLPHHRAVRDAQYASCWFPDPQLLTRSPGLKLIQPRPPGRSSAARAVRQRDPAVPGDR